MAYQNDQGHYEAQHELDLEDSQPVQDMWANLHSAALKNNDEF